MFDEHNSSFGEGEDLLESYAGQEEDEDGPDFDDFDDEDDF